MSGLRFFYIEPTNDFTSMQSIAARYKILLTNFFYYYYYFVNFENLLERKEIIQHSHYFQLCVCCIWRCNFKYILSQRLKIQIFSYFPYHYMNNMACFLHFRLFWFFECKEIMLLAAIDARILCLHRSNTYRSTILSYTKHCISMENIIWRTSCCFLWNSHLQNVLYALC